MYALTCGTCAHTCTLNLHACVHTCTLAHSECLHVHTHTHTHTHKYTHMQGSYGIVRKATDDNDELYVSVLLL